MAWFCGIDVGSVGTKAVLTKDGEISFYHVIMSGANYTASAKKVMGEVLAIAGLSVDDVSFIAATGYGAARTEFANEQFSDISCCARGVHRVFPNVRTVVDIGGQASKVIRINSEGKSTNFVISERCAAGSGRFLQVIARVLQIDLQDAGPLSLKSNNPVTYTTGCAVFGESEAVSRVAEGRPKEDILAGVQNAIAAKVTALVDRVRLEEECAMVGGGALDIGLVKRTEEKLGVTLRVPEHPRLMAALGAALYGRERVDTSSG
ncbi:acyl-CoA dehydratase activase [Thermodesulfobacteriota bacterium]